MSTEIEDTIRRIMNESREDTPTTREFIQIYLDSAQFNALAAASVEVRLRHLRVIEDGLGDLRLDAIRYRTAVDFLKPYRDRPGTASATLKTLKLLLNLAIEHELIHANPLAGRKSGFAWTNMKPRTRVLEFSEIGWLFHSFQQSPSGTAYGSFCCAVAGPAKRWPCNGRM